VDWLAPAALLCLFFLLSLRRPRALVFRLVRRYVARTGLAVARSTSASGSGAAKYLLNVNRVASAETGDRYQARAMAVREAAAIIENLPPREAEGAFRALLQEVLQSLSDRAAAVVFHPEIGPLETADASAIAEFVLSGPERSSAVGGSSASQRASTTPVASIESILELLLAADQLLCKREIELGRRTH